MRKICQQKGHKRKTITRRISTGMDHYMQTIEVCKRFFCNYEKEATREHLRTYNTVTMPQSYWDKIREKGYIVWD